MIQGVLLATRPLPSGTAPLRVLMAHWDGAGNVPHGAVLPCAVWPLRTPGSEH